MSPFYVGLLVITLIAIAVVVCSITMKEWCISFLRKIRVLLGDGSFNSPSLNPYVVSLFEYKKRVDSDTDREANSKTDCAVCLSGFEEGDEIKQLPRCKHSFHTPCIDKWLDSHSDCPVCRAPVDRLASKNGPLTPQENSQVVNISTSA